MRAPQKHTCSAFSKTQCTCSPSACADLEHATLFIDVSQVTAVAEVSFSSGKHLTSARQCGKCAGQHASDLCIMLKGGSTQQGAAGGKRALDWAGLDSLVESQMAISPVLLRLGRQSLNVALEPFNRRIELCGAPAGGVIGHDSDGIHT